MILDHIENIVLSNDDTDKHHDALQALWRLGEGLHWISEQVSTIEEQAKREAIEDQVNIAIVGGVLDDKPLGLLACAFQWYAISACNYAQLVGWLHTRDAVKAKKYVRRVMPRLLTYRNKVAAHFALTDPQRDNEADLAASVMTQIVYVHGRLCAAALSPIINSDDDETKVSHDLSWSLTVAHFFLTRRYWVAGSQKATQSLRIGPGETRKMSVDWSEVFWHHK